MAFNFIIFTCKRSKSFPLFSSLQQITSRVFEQRKKSNVLSSLIHFSSHEPVNENFFNAPEVKKYLDFIQGNIFDFVNTINMNSKKSEDLISLIEKKKHIESEIKNLCNMSKEDASELGDLVEEEKHNLQENLSVTFNNIFEIILAHEEENENRNAEIQIISGIGGSEAKLFAHELFDMYVNYSNYKNWTCYVIDKKAENSELSSANILISGDFVFNYMKHEGGVHRVQRVPETEKGGRTHTSTCSVVVLPQPKPHEIVIKPKDVVIEKTTSCGAGGQNVNKRETAIRLKHIPTGIVVESQDTRYQFKNKDIAFERLRGILYNKEIEKEKLEKQKSKIEQAGTNDYADKIRTYNFNQGRITDHRINFSLFNLKSYFLGGKCLDEMLNKLRSVSKKETLFKHIKKVLESIEYRNFEKSKLSN